MAEDRLFSKILVLVDGSDQSMAACCRHDYQILAKRDKAEIMTLHVIQLPSIGHYTQSMLGDVVQMGKNEAEKWLSSIKSEAKIMASK